MSDEPNENKLADPVEDTATVSSPGADVDDTSEAVQAKASAESPQPGADVDDTSEAVQAKASAESPQPGADVNDTSEAVQAQASAGSPQPSAGSGTASAEVPETAAMVKDKVPKMQESASRTSPTLLESSQVQNEHQEDAPGNGLYARIRQSLATASDRGELEQFFEQAAKDEPTTSQRTSAQLARESLFVAHSPNSPQQKGSKARMSPRQRAEVQDRLHSPRPRREKELDRECTFRPVIGEKSRTLAKGGKQYLAYASQVEEKRLEFLAKKQELVDAELALCTFKPEMPGLTKYPNVTAKFLEPRKTGDEDSPGKDDATGPSPRSVPMEGRKSLKEATIEATKSLRQSSGKSELPGKDARQGKRMSTVPRGFMSHTQTRSKKREEWQEQTEFAQAGELDKLYQDLHGQLHALDLGGPPPPRSPFRKSPVEPDVPVLHTSSYRS